MIHQMVRSKEHAIKFDIRFLKVQPRSKIREIDGFT